MDKVDTPNLDLFYQGLSDNVRWTNRHHYLPILEEVATLVKTIPKFTSKWSYKLFVTLNEYKVFQVLYGFATLYKILQSVRPLNIHSRIEVFDLLEIYESTPEEVREQSLKNFYNVFDGLGNLFGINDDEKD